MRHSKGDGESASLLVAVGEALWPLVPLACRAVAALPITESVHSTRLRLASAVGAKSCVRWFLRNRPRAEEERGATDGDDGASCCNCGGGGGARGDKEKELLAVLAGLCAGGHLELAKALVGEHRSQDGDGRWEWKLEVVEGRGGHIETAKWVVERFRITELWEAVEPLLGALSHGNLGVAQWLYDEFPGCGELMQRVGVDATGEMFHSVESDRETLRLCKWLKEKFSPKEVDIRSLNNITVLKWAVSAFNIELTTETVLSFSSRFNPDFIQWAVIEKNVSLTAEFVTDTGTTGTKWFLQHVSSLQMIPESSVVQVIKESFNLELISLLLETFHLNTSLLNKVTKWFIVHYALESEQVKANNNWVLFKLIAMGKNHCAEWTMKNFAVTCPEVVTMMNKWGVTCPHLSADLRTWQLLLRNFPSLTPDVVRDHFLTLALSSPVTAKFVLRTFPTITKADMTDHYVSGRYNFRREALLWLDVPKKRR
ncbi:hypothetical protein Pelo_907 [Pelomyxa schiedti]|nr:hypothetical protein Pelo_907 [Pelomyxa schiedti]